jgi:predicted nuclease of predicted toxin-antitoxin system
MRLYLDDDSAWPLLARLLRNAGHDVALPADVGMRGQDDPVQLAWAVEQDRVLLTHNHDDFRNLHNLIMKVGGHYPGMLIVRRDNDPKRDLSPRGIVRAIGNLLAAGVSMADSFYILNHWR